MKRKISHRRSDLVQFYREGLFSKSTYTKDHWRMQTLDKILARNKHLNVRKKMQSTFKSDYNALLTSISSFNVGIQFNDGYFALDINTCMNAKIKSNVYFTFK